MSSIVEIINGIANRWSDGMWLIVWQSAILAVIIYLVTSCIRRASAATCFWLWMLVPLRLLVMPLVTISLPLLPVTSPELSGTDVGSLSTEVIAVNPADAIHSEQGLGLEMSESILSAASIERTTEKHVLPSVWAFLMTGWLIGLMLCIIRLLREWRKVIHITTQAVEAAESGILESAHEARTKLGLKHMPKILVTKERISPFLFGVLRPVLVVPEGLIANVRAEELVAVLSHEFAHVRRRDPLIGWLLAICETIYFFHPVFYHVKGRILFERERACDSWVLYSSKARSSVYANALISAADICRGFKTSVGPVGAVAESFADLKKRLVVISRNLKPKARLSISALICLLLVGAVCTPGILLTARAGEQAKAQSERTTTPAIHQAAKDGDLERVKLLISQGADINVRDQRGQTVLHYSVENDHKELAELLIDLGADVNAAGSGDGTPLLTAIFGDNVDLVRLLIDKGADCNVYDQRGLTPLDYAITAMGEKDKEIVELLVGGGANINLEDREGGRTPLHWAAFAGTQEVFELFLAKVADPDTIYLAALKGDLVKVKAFVQNGTEVNIKDKSGCTPLHWAATNNTDEVADLLIAMGADINAKDNTGNTPLLCARRLDMIQLLVSKGADVNAKGGAGYTRLHRACLENDKDMAAFLTSKGADVNIKNNWGMTPLLLASTSGDRELVELLIANGARVNMRYWNGTPLLAAAAGGHTEVVRLLIAKGADLNIPDNRGRTPLSTAQKAKQTGVVDVLLQYGAKETLHGAVAAEDIDKVKQLLSAGTDVNAKDKRGAAPLWIAARNGYGEIVEFLVNKGADINVSNNQGQTPLATAKKQGYTGIVELLRKHGAKDDAASEEPKPAKTSNQATTSGNIDRVRALLDQGIDINARNDRGRTQLHLASLRGDEELVRFLVSKGADVNVQEDQGSLRATSLHHAVVRGHRNVVEILLASGANVNAKDGLGQTPLDLAKRRSNTEIVEMLTKAAQEQTSAEKKPSDDESPAESKELKPARILHEAAAAGDIERVKSLIADGADINAKDEEGKTPLHYAAKRRNTEVTRLLIKANADLNCKDKDGETPMAIARIHWRTDVVKLLVSKGADVDLESAAYLGDLAKVRSFIESDPNVTESKLNQLLTWSFNSGSLSQGHRDIAEYLFDKGANPNAKDRNEATILHRWAWGGDLEITKSVMEIVIKRGADVNARQGELGGDTTRLAGTPLHSACSRGRTSVAKFLLDNGADVNAKNNNDQTPLDLAKRRRRTDLVELLRKYGAKE